MAKLSVEAAMAALIATHESISLLYEQGVDPSRDIRERMHALFGRYPNRFHGTAAF